MSTDIDPTFGYEVTYTYAVFDSNGCCISITKTVVPMDSGHLVPNGTKVEDVWLDETGAVRDTVAVELSLNREYFLADGMDAVEVLGLPEDAILVINGVVTWELKREYADTLMITTGGKYRSNTVVAQGAPKDYFVTKFHAKVDDEAANARTAFVTETAGQSAVYAKKEAEARALLADEQGSFPFITAEAGQDATAQVELAKVIVARAEACDQALANIEVLRMTAKKTISEATEVSEMLEALDITWPTDQEEN